MKTLVRLFCKPLWRRSKSENYHEPERSKFLLCGFPRMSCNLLSFFFLSSFLFFCLSSLPARLTFFGLSFFSLRFILRLPFCCVLVKSWRNFCAWNSMMALLSLATLELLQSDAHLRGEIYEKVLFIPMEREARKGKGRRKINSKRGKGEKRRTELGKIGREKWQCGVLLCRTSLCSVGLSCEKFIFPNLAVKAREEGELRQSKSKRLPIPPKRSRFALPVIALGSPFKPHSSVVTDKPRQTSCRQLAPTWASDDLRANPLSAPRLAVVTVE